MNRVENLSRGLGTYSGSRADGSYPKFALAVIWFQQFVDWRSWCGNWFRRLTNVSDKKLELVQQIALNNWTFSVATTVTSPTGMHGGAAL